MARPAKLVVKKRDAIFKSLNFSPEKNGPDELVERVDISLEFNVQGRDIAQFVKTRGSVLQALWEEDELVFKNISMLPIEIEAEGSFSIGIDTDRMIEFKNSTLKKASFRPMMGNQGTIKCQVRVDPTGNLEKLGKYCVTREVYIEFDGKGVVDKNQTELDV